MKVSEEGLRSPASPRGELNSIFLCLCPHLSAHENKDVKDREREQLDTEVTNLKKSSMRKLFMRDLVSPSLSYLGMEQMFATIFLKRE